MNTAVQRSPLYQRAPEAWRAVLGHPQAVATGAAFIVLTAVAIWQPLGQLWATWTTDPLRSIGFLLPPVSLWLALRVWNLDDWRGGGSWWGLPLMALSLLLLTLNFSFQIVPSVYIGGRFAFGLAPVGPLLSLYLAGAVLLFAGPSALRKAWFPVALWIFANPVPQVVGIIDMPLQMMAARSARLFAEWLSVPVSGDALTLMFSPKLGMFLAPGCNGLHGAATMGYIALVLGYVRRLPLPRLLLFVACAVAFAYLLNLVRLFFVVVYYWVALRMPVLGEYGTEVDYLIGGAVFLSGAYFLFGVSRAFQSCKQSS